MADNFSMDGVKGDGSGANVSDGGDGSGGNASDGQQWGAADEALLACQPLTSCCVAQFLMGCGPVVVHNPGVGGPCTRGQFPQPLVPIFI